MRITLMIFFGLFLKLSFAQEEVYQEQTNFKISEIISFVDEDSGETALLNFHNDGISVKLFDEDFENTNSFNTQGLPYKYESLLGFHLNNQKLSVLIASLNRKSFAYAVFDFEKKTFSRKDLEFQLKREFHLATITRNQKIYLVTAYKKNSQMNIYEFDEHLGEPKKNVIDFPEKTFVDRFDRSVDFYDALYGRDRHEKLSEPVIINRDIASSIEETRLPLKIYLTAEGFQLSIDSGIEHSIIVNVSLDKMQTKVQKFIYEKPEHRFAFRMKTNSFIYDNMLFQFSLNKDDAKLKVINLENEEVIKELVLDREEELDIANTPIVQLGGDFKDYRELETTNQFFRKTLNEADLGIGVIKRNKLYEITFGNLKELNTNEYIYVYGGNTLLSGAIAGGLAALANQFINYRNSKSVQFTGLFSQDFEHVEGEVQETIFDKISSFSKDFSIHTETFFQVKDNYFYAYFDKKAGSFSIYKFPLE